MGPMNMLGGVILMVVCFLPEINGQACSSAINLLPGCDETDPAGLVLTSFDVFDSAETWSIEAAAVPGYLELRRLNNTVELVTLQPLDLEVLNDGNNNIGTSFRLTLRCLYSTRPPVEHDMKILINAVNEFDPYFIGAPYNTSVEENSALGTTVFMLDGKAHDDDYHPSQDPISQFRLHDVFPVVPDIYFSMTGTILGIITTQQHLDFEALLEQGLTTFVLNVSAEDNGDPGPRSAFTTITVNIEDVDDENPVFAYHCVCDPPNCPPMIKGLCRVPSYFTTISQSHTGPVSAQPAQIFAVDGDMLNYTIEYSIAAGTLHNYSDYFTLNSNTGVLNQILTLEALDISQLSLTLQATEVSVARRNTLIGFTINIQGRTNAPITDPTTTPVIYDTDPPADPTKQEMDDSIALWVLFVVIGSCLLLVFVVALAVYLFLRKRHRKNVHPDDTQSSGPSNVSTEEEILDAYASETPTTKWDNGILDLSVRSGYSHTGSQQSFVNGNAHKENFMNGSVHQESLSPRHFDIVVPLGRGSQLPPLSRADMIDTSTETEETEVRKLKKKPRRRRDKTKEVEIYDGTREYDMEADPSFFVDNQKQRVKRNRRSFNFKQESDHWITVPNEY